MITTVNQNDAWLSLSPEIRSAFRIMYSDLIVDGKSDYINRPYYVKNARVLTEAFGEDNLSGEISEPPFNIGDEVVWKNCLTDTNRYTIQNIERTSPDEELWIVKIGEYGWFPASEFKHYEGEIEVLPKGSKCYMKGRKDCEYVIGEFDYQRQRYQLLLFGEPVKWVSHSLIEPCVEDIPKNVNAELISDKVIQPLKTHIENANKKNEEKLLISELLAGCEGERFFDTSFGEVVLMEINENQAEYCDLNGNIVRSDDLTYNILLPSGTANLYPSKELFEKYPLNALQAWKEWQEKHACDWWKPQPNEEYYYLDRRFIPKKAYRQSYVNSFDSTNACVTGNCFRTETLALKASTYLKQCLSKFHKQNK